MSDPFIGEIRMFAGMFAPQGWAYCDGSLLDISTNPTLFNLIGTTYGGDGSTTFGIPDLRGRVPVHRATNYAMAQMGGAESVTLSTAQLPSHSHAYNASANPGSTGNPSGAFFAATGDVNLYLKTNNPVGSMNSAAISAAGGSQPHNNMQPFLSIAYIISLSGMFPPKTN